MSKEELYNKFSELFIELAKEEHRHREEIEYLHGEIVNLRTDLDREIINLRTENQKLKDKNHQIANILMRD